MLSGLQTESRIVLQCGWRQRQMLRSSNAVFGGRRVASSAATLPETLVL